MPVEPLQLFLFEQCESFFRELCEALRHILRRMTLTIHMFTDEGRIMCKLGCVTPPPPQSRNLHSVCRVRLVFVTRLVFSSFFFFTTCHYTEERL